VDLLPIVTAAATKTLVCLGGTITLTAGGANTYTWDNGATVSSGSVITSTPSSNAVYTVTGATPFGCLGITLLSVSVVPNPTVTANISNSVICLGEVVTMTATGASNYTWAPGNAITSGSFVTTPTASTQYQVTGEDSNGCRNSTMLLVAVDLCTGLGKNQVDPTLTIFPNPNNGNFVIKGNSTLDLSIMNNLGQVVKTIRLHESTDYECQVSDLADGLYFVLPDGAGSTSKQKIIVQH
jgi:hypothetical protein